MSKSLLRAIQLEIADLEDELSRDTRYRKLEALRAAANLYLDSPDKTSAPLPSSLPTPGTRTMSPDREHILTEAETYLMGKTTPTPTRVIVSHLEKKGMEVPGVDKVSYLSAMLSKNERFTSIGRSGWILGSTEQDSTPQDSVGSGSEHSDDEEELDQDNDFLATISSPPFGKQE